MAQVTFSHAQRESPETPAAARSLSPFPDAIPIEQTPKLKGRQRLIQSLQRISSSPSLAKMSSRNASYNGTGGASMSCVSLTSPASNSYGHSYGSSYSSQISALSSNGFSTAPTSVASTPGADMRFFGEFKQRIRVLDGHRPKTPSSVPVPSGIQFASMKKALYSTSDITEASEDYFSLPQVTEKPVEKRENFSLWKELPDELRMQVLHYLKPKEIVRCSAVSKRWHAMCFDGQLWAGLNASEFYTSIPGESLVKIMKSAGPFMKELNLRGCHQLHSHWPTNSQKISDLCRNLEYFSIHGCKIDRTSLHYFLLRNPNLKHVNLSGCGVINNSAMKIIAQGCPSLQYLNVSYCEKVDHEGLVKAVNACPKLQDLRASEISGFNNEELLQALFEQNSLERLLIDRCTEFDDNALTMLMQGKDPDIDILTGVANVPPRKFRHLDFHRCRQLTNKGVKTLAHNVPHLNGLRLSQCSSLNDDSITDIFATCPHLTHLDLEEVDMTNSSMVALAKAPCATRVEHLNVSYCENLGDAGLIPVAKACTGLRSLELDNTRVSDLVLVEIAASMRARNRAATVGNPNDRPKVGMEVVAYDCANITWTGIREILSRNAEFYRRSAGSAAPVYPKEIVGLKCFYGYQPTVMEHTTRVLKGELARATLLERKWADYMVASEEAGVGGGGVGSRRRRRRLRDAERAHEDEEGVGGGVGRRRRARSGGCMVM
ncbi:MAG: hypothetical protein MMC23_000385 [Stictis urceolatum]|nr:hypothetical protein [Stictis urceolata]